MDEAAILARAKTLIQRRQYAEARRELARIPTSDTAIKWLARLDEIAPPVTSPSAPERTARGRGVVGCRAIGMAAAGVLVGFFLGFSAAPRTAPAPAPLEVTRIVQAAATSIEITRIVQVTVPAVVETSIQIVTATPLPPAAMPSLPPAFQTVTYSGDVGSVIGPVDFPAGLYRATVNTSGFFIASAQVLEGNCGSGSAAFVIPAIFNLMRGQGNGAQAVFFSSGCRTMIEVSNVQAGWTLTFEAIQ